MKSSSAFTIIELIFIIVIIGILATVAIPRLVATRDDAKVSTCIQDISVLIGDIHSFYTSRGNFEDPTNSGTSNFSAITNVKLMSGAIIDIDGNNGNFSYACADVSIPAITFTTTIAPHPVTGNSIVLMTATVASDTKGTVDGDFGYLLTQQQLASTLGVDHVIGGMKIVQ
jgi:type II secretory pathway pseudopilin PulG